MGTWQIDKQTDRTKLHIWIPWGWAAGSLAPLNSKDYTKERTECCEIKMRASFTRNAHRTHFKTGLATRIKTNSSAATSESYTTSASLNALRTERLAFISLYEECAHFGGIALPETLLINHPLASEGRHKQALKLCSSDRRQLHALCLEFEAGIDLHGLELQMAHPILILRPWVTANTNLMFVL